MKPRTRLSPNRIWITFFTVWLFFLTGAISWTSTQWFKPASKKQSTATLGAPGLIQYWQLNSLLNERKRALQDAQTQILNLEHEIALLQDNPATQERAVRSRLGYARADELLLEIR